MIGLAVPSGAMPDTSHSFLGLSENPFNITPDPRFLIATENVRQVFADLAHAIHARKGLILLTGDVGTGKTILVHHLLDHLQKQRIVSSFIFNSHLDINELFRMVLADFAIGPQRNTTPLSQLQDWLAERGRQSGNAVLIIDEAQGLSLQVLEEIRLLLDMEAARGRALQVILVGQRELDDKLRRPEYRPIRQRIGVRCTTMALSREEADEYVSGRLKVVGAGPEKIQFSRAAADLLYFYSRGVPRVLNLLCERSSLYAHATGSQPVSGDIVEEVARQLQFDDHRPIAPSPWRTRAAAAGVHRQDSSPMEAPTWELPAESRERIEKKYPVIQFPEALASEWTTTMSSEAGRELEAEKAKTSSTAMAAKAPDMTASTAPEALEPFKPASFPVTDEDARQAEAPTVESLVDEDEEAETAPVASLLAAVPAKPKQAAKPPERHPTAEWRRRTPPGFDRPVRLTLQRLKRDVANFGQSAARLAASMQRGSAAWFARPQSWNRVWDDLLRWLQEPIGGGKAHRSVSHKTAFPPPGD